jgi:hypothetical protein
MSKKTFMAAIISILLASMFNGALLVNMTKGNPIPNEQISPPPIVIQSPLNTTYDQNDIPLNFTVVNASEYYPMTYKLSYIYYVCDGEFHDYSLGMNLDRDQYCINLTGLSKGEHTLTVHAEGVGSYYISSSQWTQYTIESVQTVTFTVNKDPPNAPSPSPSPSLSPSLPSNDYLFIVVVQPGQGWDWHYNISGPLTLFYRTAKPLSWVGYSLDEAQNITIIRNGTELPTLPDGRHSLKLYGNDSEGKMYGSWVIWFSTHQNTSFPFATPTFTPSPSPTQQPTIEPSQTPDRPQIGDFAPVIIPASIIFLGIVAVSLSVCFSKRRGMKK